MHTHELPHGQLMDGESYTLVPAQWVELYVVILSTNGEVTSAQQSIMLLVVTT
jgi:hypothetical protein